MKNEELIEDGTNALNLIDLWYMFKRYWYWFVLSVMVFLGGAVYYVKSTAKIYTCVASVLIKNDSKGTSLASEAAAFEDLNVLNTKSSVDNEVLVFQSRNLMIEVVRRLNLNISYRVEAGLRELELYKESPVVLRFPDAEETSSLQMVVTPLDDKTVMLAGWKGDDEEWKQKVALKDTVETPVGKVVVTPTLYYSKMYYSVPVTVTKYNLLQVAKACNAGLRAYLADKKASIINLAIEDVSKARAEDIINTLIVVYNEDAINDKNQVAINTSNFINERLIIIEQELGGVESEIETFKKENLLTDIVSETGIYLQNSNLYQQEGLGLENQLSLARSIKEYLYDPQHERDLIPSNTGIPDVNIEQSIGKYNEMLLKRNKLQENSSEKNPIIQELNGSLSAMRQTIVRTVDNLIAGLNAQLQRIEQQERQANRRISAVPSQQKYVLSVERQQKIKEALYLYLLNKREENALSQSITSSNARVIDPAMCSDTPVAPKTSMILLAALVGGFALPGLILWLIFSLNTKINSRRELEERLTAPILGEIPLLPKKHRRKEHEIYVSENGRDAISEAFRIVRANMDFMEVNTNRLQVIVFSSFNPGAGKTFLSINMAVSMATGGKKVVLVDLDIRKGSLSERIGHKHEAGVTNYLSGKETNLDNLLEKGKYHPNLDVLYNGPIPPNPSELLRSKRLDDLLEWLKERYDYVILDNVPSNMSADAIIVNRVADLTLYVLRAGYMDKRLLPEVEKLYKSNKLKNMAILLNGVDIRYNYGYGYGYYGKGYTYGYGSKD